MFLYLSGVSRPYYVFVRYFHTMLFVCIFSVFPENLYLSGISRPIYVFVFVWYFQSVLACDFLQLRISPPFLSDDVFSSAIEASLRSLKSPVVELPEASFHIVVFSLLLEYLPSTSQRWKLCVTAHRLLALQGLLVIITPDSHHIGRRAQQMKDWRRAVEAIGFKRFGDIFSCHFKQ